MSETHTEYRVHKIDPSAPGVDITWNGPSRSLDACNNLAIVEQATHDRRVGNGAKFVVEKRTVTTSDWEAV